MFNNLKLVGTSHISSDSISEIQRIYDEFNPDTIAVELDLRRYHALMSGQQKSNLRLKDAFSLGFSGFLFMIIGRFVQKKLGNIVGIEPGSDMKKGIELAKKNQKQLLFIDRDIQITLQRFSKSFGFKEKMKILFDLFKGMFGFAPKVNISLEKVPSKKTINYLLKEIKKQYPSIYKVLIDERNKFMAKKIFLYLKNNPNSKLLCIIGAGHEEGLNSDLKSLYYSN